VGGLVGRYLFIYKILTIFWMSNLTTQKYRLMISKKNH